MNGQGALQDFQNGDLLSGAINTGFAFLGLLELGGAARTVFPRVDSGAGFFGSKAAGLLGRVDDVVPDSIEATKSAIRSRLESGVNRSGNFRLHAELDRLIQQGHGVQRHGGAVTNDQLFNRATTGFAPDGSVARRNGQITTPTSTAFNSNELLVQSDQFIRENYLGRAITLATNPRTGRVPNSVVVEGVNVGSVVGRGFEPVGKVPGLAGPLRFSDNLSNVTAVYRFDSANNIWKTFTIYPVK